MLSLYTIHIQYILYVVTAYYTLLLYTIRCYCILYIYNIYYTLSLYTIHCYCILYVVTVFAGKVNLHYQRSRLRFGLNHSKNLTSW